ncbi:MAG: hypothetical protein H7101_12420 [Deinococcales bacterium]|nr:hypothetical protein [Chitinophagaceae bacterium]
MFVHYSDYYSFDKIQQSIQPVMNIFNRQMMLVCYVPAVLLLFSAISLYWFSPKIFPKWAIVASITLTIISVVTTIFFLVPIHLGVLTSGFNQTTQNKILDISLYWQIIPSLLQVLLALILLNIFFQNIKLVPRIIFITILACVFYGTGTDWVDKFINYRFWSAIGETDWMVFRKSANQFLFKVYLIPIFIPMLLLIPFFWIRPKGIPKYLPIIAFLCYTWEFGITATYFVPKLQQHLTNKGFSLPIIQELQNNDFLYRGIVGIILFMIAVMMFYKVEQFKILVKE